MLLGMSYQNLGRDQQAMSVFEGLAREIDNRVKSLFHLARIYDRQGNREAAQETIKKYLAFCPDDDEALDLLQDEEEDGPFIQEASLPLAQLYARQGHYKEAVDIYAALKLGEMDGQIRQEARQAERQYIIKTLESWLERLKGRTEQ